MTDTNPFVRKNDDSYDILMAEKFYVLTNLHKKWGMHGKFDVVITKVIFRDEKPWTRMDIDAQSSNGRIHTAIGEFIEHYQPENEQKFNANSLFKKVEKHYGIEYETDVNEELR